MFDQQPDLDPALAAARATVDLARHRLLEVRRQFMDRQAGASDVVTAEHALSRALDQLDHVAGVGWRA